MRTILWLSAVSLSLCACLPQYEDPPLTATGEAGESVKSSSSSSTTTGGGSTTETTTSCSGSINGNVSETSSLPTTPPCTINGTVTVNKAPSGKFKSTLAQVKSIAVLALNADVDIAATFPKLVSANALQITNGGAGKAMALPASLGLVQNLSISNTQLVQFTGNNTIQSLQSFTIDNCNALKSVSAFPMAASIGTLYIDHCPELTSYVGFQALTQISTLHIDHVGKLTTLGAFSSLASVGNSIEIGSTALTTLTQFAQLQSVPTLSLYQMPALATPQFPKLATVNNFNLVDLPKMSALAGFDMLLVTKQAVICLEALPCTVLNNWLAQHLKGQLLNCSGPACKS